MNIYEKLLKLRFDDILSLLLIVKLNSKQHVINNFVLIILISILNKCKICKHNVERLSKIVSFSSNIDYFDIIFEDYCIIYTHFSIY